MSADILKVRQLSIRLEDANSSERLAALEELQQLARINPRLVCLEALPRIIQVLQERSSTEEYTECLYVLDSLVKCKDSAVTAANTELILSDNSNIELLLDLLDHTEATIGVMASQVLTELHACNAVRLEELIQHCPDGMNKLLQRLPDSSREAVRNQALVLVQQLTLKNQEMMKTVVFNEGFDMLFGIIQVRANCIYILTHSTCVLKSSISSKLYTSQNKLKLTYRYNAIFELCLFLLGGV